MVTCFGWWFTCGLGLYGNFTDAVGLSHGRKLPFSFTCGAGRVTCFRGGFLAESGVVLALDWWLLALDRGLLAVWGYMEFLMQFGIYSPHRILNL